MLGVALGPEDGASFAILTNGAGADLRPIVSCEPVIVPQSKWAEWVAPGRGSALWFPTRDGTFNVEAN
jgi:putative SOS response-associated peptidase YedK